VTDDWVEKFLKVDMRQMQAGKTCMRAKEFSEKRGEMTSPCGHV